jgi:hypothetical protein
LGRKRKLYKETHQPIAMYGPYLNLDLNKNKQVSNAKKNIFGAEHFLDI